MNLPGTREWRRRLAVAFLAVGAVLAIRTVSGDLPHDQTLVFRLGETERRVPLTLHVTLTRAGESEACAGLTFTRAGTETADPRHTLRLPDGDYVVTASWTRGESRDGGDRGQGELAGESADKEGETSRVERVSLMGGEIIVLLASRARE